MAYPSIHMFVMVSMFHSVLHFFGVLADASLMFHSAKTTNWKVTSNENFFALSAYSFKTAVADQKDAYTILCLSDGNINSQRVVAAADKIKESGDLKADERHMKEYVLWQLSSG